YGKTGRLVGELERFGIAMSRFDASRPESLSSVLQANSKLALAETISNPLVHVTDIAGLASIAEKLGVVLMIDNTFAPLLCQPLSRGAEVVTHSATKLLGGHSDLTLGVIAGRKDMIERIARISSIYGFTANPFECWLCQRGLATLAIRVRKASESALELANR